MHSTPNIHILGIQGSGKGTQAARLVSRYSLSYIASGNLFRERAQIDDELGREITSELARGMLLPDNLLTSSVDTFLNTHTVQTGQRYFFISPFLPPLCKISLQGALPKSHIEVSAFENAGKTQFKPKVSACSKL